MTRVGILGVGAVGARLARQLVSTDVDEVVIRDDSVSRAELVATSLGDAATVDRGAMTDPLDVDIVVLAGPGRVQAGQAAVFVRAGQHVVSTSDDIDDVRALLSLDHEARERGVHLVVGAGFAPGLTCVLAAHGATRFDRVDEIHVAKSGTGGPACARQHHRAIGRGAIDWRDGGWEQRPGGSGRELCWFPDPIGAQDCYRAALPDALRPGARLPGHQAGHRPRVGHPPRPPHRPAPDAVADPPRGRARRRAGRAARPAGARRATSWCSARWTVRPSPPGPWPRWRCSRS